MYKYIRPLLFCIPEELSHHLSLSLLKLCHKTGLLTLMTKDLPEAPVDLLGLRFPNPVGLAAGLDKNGDYIDALAALGFGFIEVGTVTPKPQGGNPKPRLFRLPKHKAIINRMGFNNKGVDYLLERLDETRFKGILGVNIGKNFSTPLEKAMDDYLLCFRKVYSRASYIVVNLSSPNTPGLRDLQFGEQLEALLTCLKEEQKAQTDSLGRYVPLLVKIAPDLSNTDIADISAILLKLNIDGVIATNTTISRSLLPGSPMDYEQGGLSGEPLAETSDQVIAQLSDCLQGRIPIIGVGGISNVQHGLTKLRRGASLIQLYSGLIFAGPGLLRKMVRTLALRQAEQ